MAWLPQIPIAHVWAIEHFVAMVITLKANAYISMRRTLWASEHFFLFDL